MRNVYAAGADRWVRKIDASGAQVWESQPVSSALGSLAVDPQQNVYVGQASTSPFGNIYKLDAAGTLLWTSPSFGQTARVNDLAVAGDGTVVAAYGDSVVRKLTAAGALLWEFTGHQSNIEALAVAVDADGNVFSGAEDNLLKKIDPDGNELWTATDHINSVRGIAVDAEGSVYSVSQAGFYKHDPAGSVVWQSTELGPSIGAFVDVNAAGETVASTTNRVQRHDPDGVQLWQRGLVDSNGGEVPSAVIDPEGFVYAATVLREQTRQIAPDGSSFGWAFSGHTDAVLAVAVDPGKVGAFPDEWATFPTVYVGGHPVVAAYLGATPVSNLL